MNNDTLKIQNYSPNHVELFCPDCKKRWDAAYQAAVLARQEQIGIQLEEPND